MLTNRQIFYRTCIIILLLVFIIGYILSSQSSASNIIRQLQKSGRNLAALIRQQNATDEIELSENVHNVEIIPELSILNKVKEITKCLDKSLNSKIQQRGNYWVLYNYVKAEKTFKCHESITYTTHADYSFLDNLNPLIKRWQGPISIALHAPGTDFSATLNSIAYLRDCTSPKIKEYVTFHIYFSIDHIPKEVPQHDTLFQEPFDCFLLPPYFNVSSNQMYKVQKKLLYPVNVGRNIARETAQTHYILASDIELYPSPNLIPKFLEMISLNTGPLLSHNSKVFPLPIFEVKASEQIPDNKTMLKEMLSKETAILFHKLFCGQCHAVPKLKQWIAANESKGLHVFHVGKRRGHWEPIFIGTHSDPLYDERLSWEGKRDKMTQGYVFCVLDYDFLILDNAFLVHKPGIKIYKKRAKRRNHLEAQTNKMISNKILPELKILYGFRKGCIV